MGLIKDQIDKAWRDYVVDGIASSGANDPDKSEIREIGPLIETAIANAALGALVDVVYATRAELDADLAHEADTVALVYGDATDANNDLYIKVGASGAGSWTLTTALHDIVENVVRPYIDEAEAAAAAAAATASSLTGLDPTGRAAEVLRRPGGWLVSNTSNRLQLQTDGSYRSVQATWAAEWDFEVDASAPFYVDWLNVSGVTLTVEELDASKVQTVAPVTVAVVGARVQTTITANASTAFARVKLAGPSTNTTVTAPSVTLGRAATAPKDKDYLSLVMDRVSAIDGANIGAGVSSIGAGAASASGQTLNVPLAVNIQFTADWNLSRPADQEFVALIDLGEGGTVPRNLTIAPVAADKTVGASIDAMAYRWGEDYTRFLVRIPHTVGSSATVAIRATIYALGGGGPNVGIDDDYTITLTPYSTAHVPALRTLPTALSETVGDMIDARIASEREAIRAEREREAVLITGDDDTARMITARIAAALAADAFISATGDDANAGTITAPKLTSGTATDAAPAGSAVLHKRGETHARLGVIGGAKTATQLEVGAYGDGLTRAQLDSRVRLSGLTWTLVSGTRYRTTVTLTQETLMNGAGDDVSDHFKLFDCRESEIGSLVTWYSGGGTIAANQASVDADPDPAFTIYRTGSTTPDPRNDANDTSYEVELDIGQDPTGLDFRLTQKSAPIRLVGGALRDTIIVGWSSKDGGNCVADAQGNFTVLENVVYWRGSAHTIVGPRLMRGVNVFAVGARQNPTSANTADWVLDRSRGGACHLFTGIDHSDRTLVQTGVTYGGDASSAFYLHVSTNEGYRGHHHNGIFRAFNSNVAVKFDSEVSNPAIGADGLIFNRLESGPFYVPTLDEYRDGCDFVTDGGFIGGGGTFRIRSGYHVSGLRTRANSGGYFTAAREHEQHIGEWGGFTCEARFNVRAASVETIDGVVFDNNSASGFCVNTSQVAGEEPVFHLYGVRDLSPKGKKAQLRTGTNGSGSARADVHIHLKDAVLDERGRPADTPISCVIGDIGPDAGTLPLSLTVAAGQTFGLFNRTRAEIRAAMTAASRTVSVNDETWIVDPDDAIIDVPLSLGGTV